MAKRDDMDPDDAPVSRREFREAIAKLATKDDVERYVTKDEFRAEFHAGLETWAGALEARLGAQLARHTAAILEALTTQIGVVDDKYKDLPPRVAKLEDIEARRVARRRPRQS